MNKHPAELIWLFGAITFAFGSLAASAQTFQSQEDVSPTVAYQMGATYVVAGSPTTNFNGLGVLPVGLIGSVNRALFSFDLSALPDAATLASVTFSLTVSSTDTFGSTSTNIPLELHLLTSSFNESTVTYLSQPSNTIL